MILNILACLVCFHQTPDNVPYLQIPGSYISDWSPNRSDISYGFAAGVTRKGGTGWTVAGQFNAHALANVHSQTWGIATEAVARKGSRSTLVGIEALVASYEPSNKSPKIGVNIVYKSEPTITNLNTIGLWFTSDPQTGFASGIKFDKYSLAGPKPAVLDLSEIPLEQLTTMDLIKLPNCKALRWSGEQLIVVNSC